MHVHIGTTVLAAHARGCLLGMRVDDAFMHAVHRLATTRLACKRPMLWLERENAALGRQGRDAIISNHAALSAYRRSHSVTNALPTSRLLDPRQSLG